jgi:hypothetical protein
MTIQLWHDLMDDRHNLLQAGHFRVTYEAHSQLYGDTERNELMATHHHSKVTCITRLVFSNQQQSCTQRIDDPGHQMCAHVCMSSILIGYIAFRST